MTSCQKWGVCCLSQFNVKINQCFFGFLIWQNLIFKNGILGFLRSCGIQFFFFFLSFYGIKLNLKNNQWGWALMTSIREVMFSPVWRISRKFDGGRSVSAQKQTPLTSGADTDKRNGSNLFNIGSLSCLFFQSYKYQNTVVCRLCMRTVSTLTSNTTDSLYHIRRFHYKYKTLLRCTHSVRKLNSAIFSQGCNEWWKQYTSQHGH